MCPKQTLSVALFTGLHLAESRPFCFRSFRRAHMYKCSPIGTHAYGLSSLSDLIFKKKSYRGHAFWSQRLHLNISFLKIGMEWCMNIPPVIKNIVFKEKAFLKWSFSRKISDGGFVNAVHIPSDGWKTTGSAWETSFRLKALCLYRIGQR